jgi:hypothetical protein
MQFFFFVNAVTNKIRVCRMNRISMPTDFVLRSDKLGWKNCTCLYIKHVTVCSIMLRIAYWKMSLVQPSYVQYVLP